MKPSDGTVCRVATAETISSRDSSISSPGAMGFNSHGSRPRSSLRELPQDLLHRLDRFGRHVDDRRRHFHHPPAGDVHRQRHDVVQVAVRDEPRFGAHERPRLGAQVEAELQLGKPPVGLHGGARIALDRQIAVLERLDRQIVDHREKRRGDESSGSEREAAIVKRGGAGEVASGRESRVEVPNAEIGFAV